MAYRNKLEGYLAIFLILLLILYNYSIYSFLFCMELWN